MTSFPHNGGVKNTNQTTILGTFWALALGVESFQVTIKISTTSHWHWQAAVTTLVRKAFASGDNKPLPGQSSPRRNTSTWVRSRGNCACSGGFILCLTDCSQWTVGGRTGSLQ